VTSLVIGRLSFVVGWLVGWLVGCHARALWPNNPRPIVTMEH